MKVLVTGVAGFIGSRIASRLLSEGYDVLGIDSVTGYYDLAIKRENLSNLESRNFEFVEKDINTADIDTLFDGVEVVIHQSGQPGVRSSWGSEFGEYLSANVLATQRLLEAGLRKPGLRRFVYASSSSIYGDAQNYPCVETDRPRPVSPYGVTKLAAEHLVTLYATNYGLSTVSLRYFTVYGPRQRPDMAFTRFFRAAIRREPITIFGSGEQIRDFTFIDDVVDANIRVAFEPISPGSVFNVSGGSSVTVNEVLEIVSELHRQPIDIHRTSGVKGDVFRTGGSSEAIKKAAGWKPSTPLRQGLLLQYDWAARWFG